MAGWLAKSQVDGTDDEDERRRPMLSLLLRVSRLGITGLLTFDQSQRERSSLRSSRNTLLWREDLSASAASKKRGYDIENGRRYMGFAMMEFGDAKMSGFLARGE